MDVDVVKSGEKAMLAISLHDYDVIVADLVLGNKNDGDSGLPVADYARYRRPNAKVIFVTDTSFFSDGSIFALAPNARAFVQTETPPEDLTAMVAHFGGAGAAA